VTEQQTNFLGIPITGDLNYGRGREPQRPKEELAPLVQAVLDDPLIEEFGWNQYTPYFNDGEECVFGAMPPWFKTVGWEPSEEDDGEYLNEVLGVDYSHPVLGGFKDWRDETYSGEHPATWKACRDLSAALQGGEFDHALLDLFGDHAEIKVRRDGITVDTYHHD
jgi:hypothetical protein